MGLGLTRGRIISARTLCRRGKGGRGFWGGDDLMDVDEGGDELMLRCCFGFWIGRFGLG